MSHVMATSVTQHQVNRSCFFQLHGERLYSRLRWKTTLPAGSGFADLMCDKSQRWLTWGIKDLICFSGLLKHCRAAKCEIWKHFCSYETVSIPQIFMQRLVCGFVRNIVFIPRQQRAWGLTRKDRSWHGWTLECDEAQILCRGQICPNKNISSYTNVISMYSVYFLCTNFLLFMLWPPRTDGRHDIKRTLGKISSETIACFLLAPLLPRKKCRSKVQVLSRQMVRKKKKKSLSLTGNKLSDSHIQQQMCRITSVCAFNTKTCECSAC